MPDSSTTDRSSPESPIGTPQETAQTLEAAADRLLMQGRCRGTARDADGRNCLIAALSVVSMGNPNRFEAADVAIRAWLKEHEVEAARFTPGSTVFCPIKWNDTTEDDDEVRDTLLLVAKHLRNGAVPL